MSDQVCPWGRHSASAGIAIGVIGDVRTALENGRTTLLAGGDNYLAWTHRDAPQRRADRNGSAIYTDFADATTVHLRIRAQSEAAVYTPEFADARRKMLFACTRSLIAPHQTDWNARIPHSLRRVKVTSFPVFPKKYRWVRKFRDASSAEWRSGASQKRQTRCLRSARYISCNSSISLHWESCARQLAWRYRLRRMH